MNVDGTGQTLLFTGLYDSEPTYSPDGSRILFRSSYEDNRGIYLMNADGSGAALLMAGDSDEGPCWSPDGSQFAWRSWRDGQGEIYVANIDGTGATNISNDIDLDDNPSWR